MDKPKPTTRRPSAVSLMSAAIASGMGVPINNPLLQGGLMVSPNRGLSRKTKGRKRAARMEQMAPKRARRRSMKRKSQNRKGWRK